MRLYLSSFRLGNKPEVLLEMLGAKKRTALIGNAMDFIDPSARAKSLGQEVERLKSVGIVPVEVDLRDYFDKPNALEKTLGEFDLIWVRGGNSFLLRRAFQKSGADKIIKELITNDKIVYGGYSAGIVILTPTLRGIELVDDPNVVPDGYEAPIVWDGLGLLPYSIAPHYRSDHPESEAIEKVVEYFQANDIPYKTLRDGEAIVIEGQQEKLVS